MQTSLAVGDVKKVRDKAELKQVEIQVCIIMYFIVLCMHVRIIACMYISAWKLTSIKTLVI